MKSGKAWEPKTKDEFDALAKAQAEANDVTVKPAAKSGAGKKAPAKKNSTKKK